MIRLITISFSHYNEKARWALDRFEVPYREKRYMPLFHFAPVLMATWRTGGGAVDQVSTRFSTPVMITEEGERLGDSRTIVRHVSDRYGDASTGLYFSPEAAEMEEHLHDQLGPHTRRFAYHHVLGQPGLLERLGEGNVGPLQRRLFRGAAPLISVALKRALGITAQEAERSLAAIRREIAAIDARLGGRRYLVGDRFSAADLALACMLAPVLLPRPDEGYGGVLPTIDEVPKAARELIEEVRASAAGQLALRLFREERGRRMIPVTV